MKLAIISDIHDNLINLEICLNWCRASGVEQLICCGDVANAETLQFMSEKFAGPIHLIRGNVDNYSEQEIKKFQNIIYYGRLARFELAGKKIGACHEPYLVEKVLELGKVSSAKVLAPKCDIVFYGHTHKPWESMESGVRVINPGTLGGVFAKATFAVWETEKEELELKIVELL